ncbi:hypothetical protein NPIL_574301 [Nephila pilipes]|uniref:Uncharacterized protein n=1 Tax=Nephila pilipes TaxID=299642 RepID=A0A8X6QK41_NEPPI|nr:hypothetical protein NPIL_574301 [Nephila pilipes]
MGISRRYANLMRKLICSDTIKCGRDIYIEHLSDFDCCYFLFHDSLTFGAVVPSESSSASPDRSLRIS